MRQKRLTLKEKRQILIKSYFYDKRPLFTMKALFPLILLLFGCSTAQKAHFNQLEGQWLMQNNRNQWLESWQKQEKGWSGKMLRIQAGDSTLAESIRLAADSVGWFYEATTAGQPEQGAVKFRLVAASKKRWVFENPQHDYPQRIVYEFVGSDSLVASISALTGPEKLVFFRFKRLP